MAAGEALWLWVPLAALLVAVSVALAARFLERRRPRSRPMEGLDPGITLFTSERCPGCDPVRSRLVEVLGAEGFREVKWTEAPDSFVTHRIDRVPTTAAVDEAGAGLIWEGMPPVRLLHRWKSFVNQL